MSSNKTPNYRLHSWEAGDDFSRSEFNENFAVIDTALADKSGLVAGFYTGDSVNGRVISLGFTPRAVLLMRADGLTGENSMIFGGLMLPGHPLCGVGTGVGTVAEIVEGGFKLYGGAYIQVNSANHPYYYLAVK